MSSPLTFQLLGSGIAYSASPAMMNAAFAALGLPHRYELADVTADDLPEAIQRVRGADAGGANVTVPHKAAVAALVDELSDIALRADAVNTVVRIGDRLVGDNTDLPATIDAIRRLCPRGVDRAVVLGAGGAGRAVALALAEIGADDVVLLRRSDGSMDRLGDELASADLLVNATPVGTGSDESPVPASLLRPGLAVLDLVYRPSPTRLVRDARAAGARAEAGAGVLLGQAWRSLELWLGRPAPVEAMRAALDAELGGGSDA
jgi:shikimate dehydrogenase